MIKQEEEQQQEVLKKPWVPTIITGGKDGGSISGGPDWLHDLPVGSVFFAQDKHAVNNREDKYFVLAGPFTVAYRTPNGRGVGLVLENPNGQQAMIPTDSLRFSSRYSMYDILHFGDGNALKAEQLETEAPKGDTDVADGNSEGTVQS